MNATELAVVGVVVPLAGGVTAACLRRPLADRVFQTAAVGGCGVAVTAAVRVLVGAVPPRVSGVWAVPGGAIALQLDPLGAWFTLVVALVGACSALYAPSYLAAATRPRFARFTVFFGSLLASLLLVAVTQNALLFLAVWELMTLAAYFLVTHDDGDANVRAAGRLYLLANHTAAFCLFALVAIVATAASSFDFAAIATARAGSAAAALPFVLALIAFGTKAGFVPFHIWLPHAHPVAPAPVSAMLSGVLVKAGIFGFLRFLPLLPPTPSWGAPTVVAIGVVSGVLGVLYALAQHDLKRLLAYHTVENIGIILLGVGVGMIGLRAGHPVVAMFGFAGALLHMLNHALFKALLFLGAGAVVRATGTGEMDRLGGLARRMPWTAVLFLVGCVSIAALPPGNGFVSEWSIYVAAFTEATSGSGTDRMWCLAAVLALALIGGLAAACFAKAFTTVFLGEPRSAASAGCQDPPAAQRLAMVVPAVACIGVGVLPWLAARAVWPVVRQIAGTGESSAPTAATPAAWGPMAVVAAVFLAVGAVVWVVRCGARRENIPERVATWGCGYTSATSRMQYTSASFAAPLLIVFRALLRPRVRHRRATALFPEAPGHHTSAPDTIEEGIYRPAFRGLGRVAALVRSFQRMPVQAQAALVMAALAALLLWKVVP